MKTYLFKTVTKPAKCHKYEFHINFDAVRDVMIKAKDLDEAFEKYRETININERVGCYRPSGVDMTITKNAIKNKQPLYAITPAGNLNDNGCIIKASFINNRGKKKNLDLFLSIYQMTQVAI